MDKSYFEKIRLWYYIACILIVVSKNYYQPRIVYYTDRLGLHVVKEVYTMLRFAISHISDYCELTHDLKVNAVGNRILRNELGCLATLFQLHIILT
jgi:hypothetical protein